MLQSLQEIKYDALLLLLYNLIRRTSSSNNHSNNKKQHNSSMRTAPKQVDYISVISNKFLYAYMPHTYTAVN